jgi:hypothetical protein
MKKHNWTIKTIDGGSVGIADFWKCSDCGAGGGIIPTTREPKDTERVFFPNGSGLSLTHDCDESKEIIKSMVKQAAAHYNWEPYAPYIPPPVRPKLPWRPVTIRDLKEFIKRHEAQHPNLDDYPIHYMDMDENNDGETDESYPVCIPTEIEIDRFDDEVGWVVSLLRTSRNQI